MKILRTPTAPTGLKVPTFRIVVQWRDEKNPEDPWTNYLEVEADEGDVFSVEQLMETVEKESTPGGIRQLGPGPIAFKVLVADKAHPLAAEHLERLAIEQEP